MLLFFLTAFLGPGPDIEIKLDNRNRFLPNLDFNRVRLAHDGTFLAMTNYQLWHWNQKGELLNLIGGKGQGPGEFMFIVDVDWDGSHYWIIDGSQLKSSVFDAKGNYLSVKPVWFRQLIRVQERLFAVDYRQVDPFKENYPRVLKEIKYRIADNQLEIDYLSEPFRKVTPRQMSFKRNFKLIWVAAEDDTLFVMDQLEPKIDIYDPKAIESEKSISIDEPYEPRFVPIQARRWVEPPDTYPKRNLSQRDWKEWWRSWSRINYFSRIGADFLVAYETPDPDDPQNSFQVLQRIQRDGRAKSDVLVIAGYIMGAMNDKVYIFAEDEEAESFNYYVRIFSL